MIGAALEIAAGAAAATAAGGAPADPDGGNILAMLAAGAFPLLAAAGMIGAAILGGRAPAQDPELEERRRRTLEEDPIGAAIAELEILLRRRRFERRLEELERENFHRYETTNHEETKQ